MPSSLTVRTPDVLPWADRLTPDARLLVRLATLLGLMATEARQHPELYREPPDDRLIRATA